MPRSFTDIIVDSRLEFLGIVGQSPVAFVEIYRDTPHQDLELLFDGTLPDEMLLRLDMDSHNQTMQDTFCAIDDLDRRVYGFHTSVVSKPLPYFTAYVRSMGYIALAWTAEEIRKLIARTHKDRQMLEVALRKQHNQS